MSDGLRLMAVFAHPDDESLGAGGTLAKYAAEGVQVTLLCATRGECGWSGYPAENPGLAEMGRIRTVELAAAAEILGIHEVVYLDTIDGEVDQAAPDEAIGRIVALVRRVRPQVVVTFGPDGDYGHPDHVAISQFTQAALVAAAYPGYQPESAPYCVAKLYYLVNSRELEAIIKGLTAEVGIDVDGVRRQLVAWDDWAITTRIDAGAHWRTVWAAIQCHVSQVSTGFASLYEQPESLHEQVWGNQSFYRVYSLVNGGRAREDDLFAGLR